jgi:hypothetical protein
MRKLQDSELARLRAIQAATFNDVCDIITNVLSQDETGDVVETPTTHEDVECGVAFVGAGSDGRKPMDAYTKVEYDAIIRLPLSLEYDIDMNTEYLIVTKAGTEINKTFRPVASPEISSSAQNVKVKEVTN